VDKTTKRCSIHDRELSYMSSNDAYYCEKCDEWAEDECSDDFCGYCRNRPDQPSQVEED